MDEVRRSAAVDGHRTGRPPRSSSAESRGPELGTERCTLIIAPAGTGKTTLLARWYEQFKSAGEQPAWHSVTAGHDIHLPPHPASTIGHRAAGRALFIDNAERLPSSEIDATLRAMTDGAFDAPSRLVLASRAVPDRVLDWSRHGTVRTVRVDELEAPPGLIDQILLDYQPDLRPDELAVLGRRIAGWPAGAHLAGRALRSPTRSGFAATRFDGRDVGVTDYFDTEIFGGLEAADQDFLVTCSVLRELSVDACAMLTGDQLAEERLLRLGREHAFISPSPAVGTWRWRPLARTYLEAKLTLRPSDEAAELRRRVRGWSMARGHYREAIAQATETSDWHVTIRLVLDVGLDTIAAGHADRVLDWVEAVPPEIRRKAAGLATVAAVAEWASGGYHARDTVDDWLAHAKAIGEGRPPSGAPSTALAADIIGSLLGCNGLNHRSGDLSDPRPAAASRDEGWEAARCSALGVRAYLDDDTKQAGETLSSCLRRHGPRGEGPDWFQVLFRPSAVALLALIEQEAGEHGQAGVLISMAVAERSWGRATGQTDTGVLALAEARQARHEGDRATAQAGLRSVAESAGLVWVRALALIDTADLCARHGDRDGQAANLATVDRLLEDLRIPPRLLLRLRAAANRQDVRGADDDPDSGLTERELEVLRLLASDLTRRQIATQLFLAHNTVKTYIQRLYQKLDVSSRPAALSRARELGWLD